MAYPHGSYGPGRSIEAAVEHPVVIILDMAKGYGWEPGSWGYDPMVKNVRRLKDAAHAAGVQVIHVHSLRRPTDHLPSPELNSRMVVGTEGLDVIPELQPVDQDIQIYKRYLSGFSENDLGYTLRTMGCDCVIIAGASADNTVLWTALEAFERRYKVVVVDDCVLTHSQARTEAGGKTAALMLIRGVLQSEVAMLDDVISKYLQPKTTPYPIPAGSYGPGRSIEAPVTHPAVIILDMAKGYGWQPGSYGYEMVANVRQLKDAAHAAGVQVIHVHSMRRPTDNLPFPESNSKLVAGTEGIEVIPELLPMDGDIQIYKRYLGGFTQNDLDYTLRTMGVDCVILAGASTDNCVLWTAADAFQLRYRVVVAEDCTMVHRQNEPPGAKEAALHIISTVLQSEVIPLKQIIDKYLPAK